MGVERITYVECDRCKRTSISLNDCNKKVAINIARERGFTIGKEVMCPRCSNLYAKR